MSEHRWFRLLPEWLVSCRANWLRPDIVAGLTTGAVIFPKAMAYAMMAGLPVQVEKRSRPKRRAALPQNQSECAGFVGWVAMRGLMARTRTGLSAAFLFFSGATMMSDPVSGSSASRADRSTT